MRDDPKRGETLCYCWIREGMGIGVGVGFKLKGRGSRRARGGRD